MRTGVQFDDLFVPPFSSLISHCCRCVDRTIFFVRASFDHRRCRSIEQCGDVAGVGDASGARCATRRRRTSRRSRSSQVRCFVCRRSCPTSIACVIIRCFSVVSIVFCDAMCCVQDVRRSDTADRHSRACRARLSRHRHVTSSSSSSCFAVVCVCRLLFLSEESRLIFGNRCPLAILCCDIVT